MTITTRQIRVQVRDEKTDRIEYAMVTVEIEVDYQQIAQELGWKALRNKSRKSKLACGITAKIVQDIKPGYRRTGL
jgi:hypothetical protein